MLIEQPSQLPLHPLRSGENPASVAAAAVPIESPVSQSQRVPT